MPVFTGAFLAVAAAIAAPSLVTVATAVIAVSAAIGVVGTVLSVVAMVTGSELLGDIGKYMGYAGLAGGLGGLAMGGTAAAAGYSKFLGEAWDSGVGSFLGAGSDITAPSFGVGQETLAGNFSTGVENRLLGAGNAGQASRLLGADSVVGNITPASNFNVSTLGGGLGKSVAEGGIKSAEQILGGVTPPSGSGQIKRLLGDAAGAVGKEFSPDTSKPNTPQEGSTWGTSSFETKAALISAVAGGATDLIGSAMVGASEGDRLEFDRQLEAERTKRSSQTTNRVSFGSPKPGLINQSKPVAPASVLLPGQTQPA